MTVTLPGRRPASSRPSPAGLGGGPFGALDDRRRALAGVGPNWFASVMGTSIAALWAEYIAAVALGLVCQYIAIAPMRRLSFRKGIVAAAKADFLSLTAFEIGLFGWMALMAFVFFPNPHLMPTSPVFGSSCRSAWSSATSPPDRPMSG
jgi:hypothetical protein